MPFEQGFGLEQEDDLTEPRPGAVRHDRQFAGEDEQGEFLPPGKVWWTVLCPLKDAQLLAEEQVG